MHGLISDPQSLLNRPQLLVCSGRVVDVASELGNAGVNKRVLREIEGGHVAMLMRDRSTRHSAHPKRFGDRRGSTDKNGAVVLGLPSKRDAEIPPDLACMPSW
jgi:hypothetical protein